MPMSPEQRAEKLYEQLHGVYTPDEFKLRMARAIRAAENAALERAAALAQGYNMEVFGTGAVYEVIRSLKSCAPRARRKS